MSDFKIDNLIVNSINGHNIKHTNNIVYNTYDYNIIGDGITDDTKQLKELIQLIPNNSIINIQGEILISSVCIDLRNKNNITFQGGKIKSMFEQDYFIMIKNCSNIIFRNIVISTIFKNTKWNEKEHCRGIRFTDCNDTAVYNCVFEDIPFVAIDSTNSLNVTVQHCTFNNMGGNCLSTNGDSSYGIIFNSNVVNGCYDSFIGTHRAKNIIISDNILYKEGGNNIYNGATGYGIDIAGGQDVVISNNIIIASENNNPSNYKTGLNIHVHKYLGVSAKNVLISNNIIKYGNGIKLDEGVENIIITKNNIFNTNNALILKDNLDTIKIINNIFDTNIISIKGDIGKNRKNLKIKDNIFKNGLKYNILCNDYYNDTSFEDNILDQLPNQLPNRLIENKIKHVDTIEELETLNGVNGDVIIITDLTRGGIFIYNDIYKTQNINNGGTIIHCWVRQYASNIKAVWFKHNGNEWGRLITFILRDMRTDIDRNIKHYNSRILELPAIDVYIKTPIILSQGSNLIGSTYRTNIICDFSDDIINHPENCNIFGHKKNKHIHYVIDKLQKVPMIYNWWLMNYQELSNIRLDGNGKDVYGFYGSEVYYCNFKNLNIRNTNGSGFTLLRGQFNTINMLSIIQCGGPTRIIGCSTLEINGLNIEESKSKSTQLEIVHDSKWKSSIIINNFHQEENSNGIYNEGDIIQIRQCGVTINDMFATYRSDLSYDRYFHIMDASEYYFDGCTIMSTKANDFKLLDRSTGSSVEFKVDDGLNGIVFDGTAADRFDYHNIPRSTQINLDNVFTSSSFKILSNISKKIKTMWSSSDTRINFGDNSNRFLEMGNDSSFDITNSYGRINITAGNVLSDINFISDNIEVASFNKKHIILNELPTYNDNLLKNQLYIEDGFIKIK